MKIKKILGSLIIGFGLINISYGDYTVHPINGYANSTGDPTSEIGVLTKGNLNTINLNISKNVFSPLNGLVFYRDENQNPILILPDSGVNEQRGGELKYYYTCDKIPDSNFNGMENCGNAQIINKTYLSNFLSTVSSSDRWAYQLINGFNQQYKFQICFSSSELDKSLCFGVASRAYNLRINLYQFTLENNINPFSGDYINVYNYNFDNIPNNVIGNSPGGNPQTNNNTTTNQYTCPTIQQLIDTYPEQYNTGLCYSNSLIYSGGQFTTITPKTIFELYPTYIQFQNDINNYNNYCKAPNTQETCQGAFNGKNEKYTLISKIPQDVTPIQLYAYCNLTLNQDPNSTTCTASTGAINNGIGIDDIIDNIGNTPITVITPGTPPEDQGNGTGSVFDKYTQEEDETKRRNVIQKAEDTIQTMKEIYAKLTGIFRARQGKNGIVPPLITGLIALIILYKLFKK